MLTKKQRQRLAREARKLADEVVNGVAPHMGTSRYFLAEGKPSCALGHIQHRSGIGDWSNSPLFELPDAAQDAWEFVIMANDHQPDALPWTLLALADALEAT